MINFVNKSVTDEDKIMGRVGADVHSDQYPKSSSKNYKSAQKSKSLSVKKPLTDPDRVFSKSRLYTVQKQNAHPCVFNGFEIAQLLSCRGKAALTRGELSVVDQGCHVTFKKEI